MQSTTHKHFQFFSETLPINLRKPGHIKQARSNAGELPAPQIPQLPLEVTLQVKKALFDRVINRLESLGNKKPKPDVTLSI